MAGGVTRQHLESSNACGCRHEGAEGGGIARSIVESALLEFRQELVAENVEGLTQQHQALLQAIEEQGRIAPSARYELYPNRVDDPKSDRTIRNYLTTLERYNLITAVGSTRNQVYPSRLHRQPWTDTLRFAPNELVFRDGWLMPRGEERARIQHDTTDELVMGELFLNR